ncbi:receptor-like protein 12 [Tanacetum coccineum]|uniref:Receptor-like protein 12 n=1 Tax=Tanacetum coccineum TaxID=301880 RepID=A0ABQ5E4R2_9ASTR
METSKMDLEGLEMGSSSKTNIKRKCIETSKMDLEAAHTCIDKERQALLDFKAPLQDPYDNLSTWRPEEEDDCCQWSGVRCNNQTGHVTELKLKVYYLGGEISLSLLNLTYLSYLDLCEYKFSGVIPESIGSLTELTSLDLSDNVFYGTIPREYGNLTNLEHLHLDSLGSCRVENLDWLSSLSSLEVLFMDGTSLAKENNWLEVLVISGNKFDGNLSDFLNTLSTSATTLETLDASSNQFVGIYQSS